MHGMSVKPGYLPFMTAWEEEETATREHRNHARAPRKIGLAGESLTEFFLWQFCENVTKAAEGSAYDILAEYHSRILKIQVKTSRYCYHGKNLKAYRYDFIRKNNSVSLSGNRSKYRRFVEGECDAFALVAFEMKRVVFVLGDHGRKTMTFDRQSFDIDEIERISFDSCIKRLIGTSGAVL
jgi:hypothetical protein